MKNYPAMRFKSWRFLVILPSIFIFFSCLNEAYTCPDGIVICFKTQNPKHELKELMETADIYIYETDGSFAGRFHFDNNQLRQSDYAAHIKDFPRGNYKALVSVNQKDVYELRYGDAYNTASAVVGEIPEGLSLPLLFTGDAELSYSGNEHDTPEITVPVIKHNNHIRLRVLTGKYMAPAGRILDAYIRGRNGSYEFAAHSCNDDTPVIYPQEKRAEPDSEGNYEFNLTTLRLWKGADIKLHIEEKDIPQTRSSNKHIILDLVEEIGKVRDEAGNYLYDTDEKLQFQDEYDIVVTTGDAFVVIDLSINGWYVIRGGIEV